MNEPQVESYINKLDFFEKQKIYSLYLSIQLGLKYRADIEEITKRHGHSKPEKTVHGIDFRWLWKNIPILSFIDFSKKEIYSFTYRFQEELKL